jgi:hypothetical protein
MSSLTRSPGPGNRPVSAFTPREVRRVTDGYRPDRVVEAKISLDDGLDPLDASPLFAAILRKIGLKVPAEKSTKVGGDR